MAASLSFVSLTQALVPVISLIDFDDAIKLAAAVLGPLQASPQELLALAVAAPAAAASARHLWVLTAAAAHAADACNTEAGPLLEAAVAHLFLPLLCLAGSEEPPLPTRSLLQHLASTIAASQRWDLACAIVQAANSGRSGDEGSSELAAEAGWLATLLQLPAHLRVELAAAVAEVAIGSGAATAAESLQVAAVAAAAGAAAPGELGTGSAQGVLALASGEGFQAALGMLRVEGTAQQRAQLQQAVVRQLLPASLRAAEPLGRLPGCLAALLDTCRELVSGGPEERRLGLALLVQFSPQLLLRLPGEAPLLGTPAEWLAADEEPAGRGPPPAWQLLRESLLDPEPLNRKRAAHVLKAALAAAAASGTSASVDGGAEPALPQPWATFFKLYESLEDFALYLVQETWPDIDQLHPAAEVPAAPGLSAAAPVALPKHGGRKAALKSGKKQQQGQQQQGEQQGKQQAAKHGQQATAAPALPFAWMRVLYLKGLQHSNPQVQRIAAASLLNRAWASKDPEAAAHLRSVPAGFLAGHLLQALGQPHMHKGEPGASSAEGGSKRGPQPSSSDGSGEPGEPQLSPAIVGAVQLVRRYCEVAAPAQRRELLLCLLQQLAEQGPARGFVQTAMAMLGAVADALVADAASSRGEPGAIGGGEAGSEAGWAAEVLRLLRAFTKNCVAYGTSHFVMGVYTGLAHVAAAAVRTSQPAELVLLGSWVADFPVALTQEGAPIHAAMADMVFACSGGRQGELLAGLVESFFAQAPAGGGQGGDAGAAGTAPVTQAELAAWSSSAAAIARLAMLAASCRLSAEGAGPAVDLGAVFRPLAATLGEVYRRPYLSRGAAERSLALLQALLEAATPIAAGVAPLQLPTPLQLWLAGLVAGCAEELCSYAGLKSQALWVPQASKPAGVSWAAGGLEAGMGNAESATGSSLPAELAAAVSLAQLSVCCLADALTLLVQLAPSGGSLQQDGARQGAARHYAVALQQGVQDFLTCYGSPGTAEQAEPQGQLELSVARLELLTTCLRGLTAGQLLLGPAAAASMPQPGRLLAALLALCEQAASGGPGSVRHSKLWWQAIDGLLRLQSGGGGNSCSMQSGAWGEEELRAALGEEAAGQLLQAAISSIKGAHRACLAPMLRCIRTLLPLAVRYPTVLRSAGAASLAALLSTLYGAAWPACKEEVRRKTGFAAAFVATCLHPVLFDVTDPSDERLALHRAVGPVRQLVEQLAAVGQRTVRVATFAALQLCGIWTARPLSALCYQSTLLDFCLYGPVDKAGAEPGEVLVDGESVAALAAVMRPTDPELAEAYATTTTAPRVAALCLLHEWASTAAVATAPSSEGGSSQQGGGSGSARGMQAQATEAAAEAWAQLLCLALNDPHLSSSQYAFHGPTHRKKLRLWQALCVLSPSVPAAQAAAALDSVAAALSPNNAPSVKHYMEAVAAQLIPKDPALLEEKVLPLLRDYNSKSDLPVSMVLVGAQVLLPMLRPAGSGEGAAAGMEQEEPSPVVVEYARAVLGWTLYHGHSTRTFALLVLWRLLELCPALLCSDPSLGAALEFLTTNAELQRLRVGLAGVLRQLEAPLATSPRAVLCESDSAGAEGVPRTLLERIAEFLVESREELRQRMAAEQAAIAAAELARSAGEPAAAPDLQPTPSSQQQQQQQQQAAATPAAAQPPQQGATKPGGAAPWQRKATPLEQSLLVQDPWAAALGMGTLAAGAQEQFDQLLAGAAAEAAQQAGRRRQDIIVCASLVDRIPNLAGLCRTCEVFSAGRLVVADASVTRDPGFAQISVTAEQWIPIEEVQEAALLPWLRQQAARGYCLVGLEQTAESTKLQDFSFPPKTVLVLGREREGIPAELLAALHATVEIPQLGLIRSLNVHVSASIALFEYTRQRLVGPQ